MQDNINFIEYYKKKKKKKKNSSHNILKDIQIAKLDYKSYFILPPETKL